MEAINVDQLTHSVLAQVNKDLAAKMQGDVVLINSGMFPPLDDEFRVAIEAVRDSSSETHLIVILETNGGLMETVERLVAVMRAHYEKVSFVIPNFAYSAGTAWIQVSSATVDLKAASSSAMASSGVLHPRVLRGRWFIRRATSLSSV